MLALIGPNYSTLNNVGGLSPASSLGFLVFFVRLSVWMLLDFSLCVTLCNTIFMFYGTPLCTIYYTCSKSVLLYHLNSDVKANVNFYLGYYSHYTIDGLVKLLCSNLQLVHV